MQLTPVQLVQPSVGRFGTLYTPGSSVRIQSPTPGSSIHTTLLHDNEETTTPHWQPAACQSSPSTPVQQREDSLQQVQSLCSATSALTDPLLEQLPIPGAENRPFRTIWTENAAFVREAHPDEIGQAYEEHELVRGAAGSVPHSPASEMDASDVLPVLLSSIPWDPSLSQNSLAFSSSSSAMLAMPSYVTSRLQHSTVQVSPVPELDQDLLHLDTASISSNDSSPHSSVGSSRPGVRVRGGRGSLMKRRSISARRLPAANRRYSHSESSGSMLSRVSRATIDSSIAHTPVSSPQGVAVDHVDVDDLQEQASDRGDNPTLHIVEHMEQNLSMQLLQPVSSDSALLSRRPLANASCSIILPATTVPPISSGSFRFSPAQGSGIRVSPFKLLSFSDASPHCDGVPILSSSMTSGLTDIQSPPALMMVSPGAGKAHQSGLVTALSRIMEVSCSGVSEPEVEAAQLETSAGQHTITTPRGSVLQMTNQTNTPRSSSARFSSIGPAPELSRFGGLGTVSLHRKLNSSQSLHSSRLGRMPGSASMGQRAASSVSKVTAVRAHMLVVVLRKQLLIFCNDPASFPCQCSTLHQTYSLY